MSLVNLLKKELTTSSLSEQIYQKQKEHARHQEQTNEQAKKTIVQDNKTPFQKKMEQRRKFTEQCQREHFLRKEKVRNPKMSKVI